MTKRIERTREREKERGATTTASADMKTANITRLFSPK